MINRKAVWRAISTGHPEFLALLASLEGGERDLTRQIGNELAHDYSLIMATIDTWYLALLDYIYDEDIESRKDIAAWIEDVVPYIYADGVYRLLDQKDIQTKVWKMVEPQGGGK